MPIVILPKKYLLFDFRSFLPSIFHPVRWMYVRANSFMLCGQVAGLVRRRIEFSAREIRTFKAEVVPAFADTGIGLACSLDELAFPLERPASFTRGRRSS